MLEEEEEDDDDGPAGWLVGWLVGRVRTQIGFGDAGAHIIARNISSVGQIKVLMPGQKVVGIFGFCDIRQFTGAFRLFEHHRRKEAMKNEWTSG